MRKWLAGKCGFLKGTIFGAMLLFVVSMLALRFTGDPKKYSQWIKSAVDNAND